MFSQKLLCAVLLSVGSLASANMYITSPKVTNWGVWGSYEKCPFGTFAQGFQLKTESDQGILYDDTALNAIRIYCGDPFKSGTPVVTSLIGDYGNWGQKFTCYPGVLNGFQLRVESERPGSGDDTATNNIRFWCSSLSNPNDYIQGDGMSWGDWSEPQHCYGNQAICAIQTQVEPYQGGGVTEDDTMLNNVSFECCDYDKDKFEAEHKQEAQMNPKFRAVQ